MPSAKQRRPARLAENARFAVPVRRGIRHSSPVGINGEDEQRRSAGLLTQTLERIANGWPSSDLDALLP